jgi:WD40 repeat protein
VDGNYGLNIILQGHTRVVRSVAFDNNGILASASDDYTIKLWNTATGQLLKTLKGHNDYVENVAFDTNGLLARSSYKENELWNTQTGQLINTLEGHTGTVYFLFVASVAFDKNGLLASGA